MSSLKLKSVPKSSSSSKLSYICCPSLSRLDESEPSEISLYVGVLSTLGESWLDVSNKSFSTMPSNHCRDDNCESPLVYLEELSI